MHYASPSSLTTGSSACEQDICSCFLAAVVCPRTTSKASQFLGLGCGLSEGGSLPSGVGGVSSKAAASIFVPSIAVPSRPPRSFWISQIYRSSVPLSLSLSRPHLANDEAHEPSHGYACSESTSASLRPKEDTPYLAEQNNNLLLLLKWWRPFPPFSLPAYLPTNLPIYVWVCARAAR